MADQGTEGLLSPWLREQRFKAARPYVRGRVLDVGCGSGAFARFVGQDDYVGVDRDQLSLERARSAFPRYCFRDRLPEIGDKFDTILSLAVIEHVSSPERFLSELAEFMRDKNSKIIVTTPHPSVDWVHDAGAAVGLFSKHANEEHEALLDKVSLRKAAQGAGLKLQLYKRFLFGANQLAVFSR